jgi:heme/copper-type cytochrome/quinol oxidase subunit 1
MFTTVRYFIKTSIIFLVIGLLTGLYMSVSSSLFGQAYSQELVSAHTHLILLGSVMMMIMGVALWFFPRPEKEDKKYKPYLISIVYWVLTVSTLIRYIFQLINAFNYSELNKILITVFSFLQICGIVLFFYSIWGRIRSVGSHIREAKGEKF